MTEKACSGKGSACSNEHGVRDDGFGLVAVFFGRERSRKGKRRVGLARYPDASQGPFREPGGRNDG